jgi:hypothetical protein
MLNYFNSNMAKEKQKSALPLNYRGIGRVIAGG